MQQIETNAQMKHRNKPLATIFSKYHEIHARYAFDFTVFTIRTYDELLCGLSRNSEALWLTICTNFPI